MLVLMAERLGSAASTPSASSGGHTSREGASRVEAASLSDPAHLLGPHSDALATRVAHGERGALNELLSLHARRLASLCHTLMGATEAKDATQAAFERIVRELPRFDVSRGSFFGWSSAVTRNVCRDRLRRRGLERATFAADGEPLATLAASQHPDPERAAMTQEHTARLARALEELPSPMRRALLLFHLHEQSYEEIAGALDVPMGTVMTWLHRGRSRLRAAIEEP